MRADKSVQEEVLPGALLPPPPVADSRPSELISQGDVGTARKEFENASRLRCNGRPSVAGMLALARLTFASGQYSEALALFRRVLRECPSCPADVRVGIGACHFRLGDVASAKAAYERAVEVDPLCTQALLGLAVLTLAVGVDADATQKGSRLLAQAFQQDPDNPHTLALLAHFSLQQGLAESALKLAQAALDRVGEDEPALKAEAVCLVGRAQHALGALPEALRSYAGALKEDRNQPIARFALAQLSILRGENVNAATSLESLLEDRPGWEDALRLLAPLCPRQATATAAARPARHFKLAAERRPDDAELWEMLGDVLAGADPAGALNAYSKAIELHRKKDKAGPTNGGEVAMPSRLLNNAAVLHMRGGNIAEALALVAESLASATGGGLQALGPQAQVTLGYNAARIREASGDAKGAEVEYKALLGQFPQYADCHLRLACLAKARGDIAEAESWAHRAAEASGRSADSLALMAGLHLERRDTEAAKRCLEELLDGLPEGASRQELYAKVGLGNVHLLSVPGELQLQENVRKAEAQLTNAMNRYRRVLDRDPGNVYAANGLGCVLAEAGLFGQARDVFLSVQEAAAGTDGFLRLPDAWINLASVYLGLKQYDAAEHTYVNAIRRFADPTDARLLLYLAKAQYDGGKPGEAAKTITRALHLAPSDPRLRFNLAYLLQEKAGQIVKKKYAPGDRKKPVELAAAERSLRQCHKMFEALHAAGKDATGIPPSKLVTHIKYAAEMHEQALRRARHATEEAQAAAALLEEQRLKMEAAAKRREMEEARKLAEAKALEQAREEMAREGVRKLERMKEEWRQGAVLSKAAAAGDSGAVVRGREREAAEPDAMDAMFADEEDDDDYDPAAVDEEFGELGGRERC